MANKPPFNGEWVKLGDVATYVNGYAFKPADYSSEGLPIVRIQDLTGNAYQTNKFNGSIPDKYRIVSGDVLISWSASLGVYVWDKGEAYLNQHIFKVNFDKTKMNKSFFVHQATRLIKKSANQAHGATMTHLTKKVFEALPFWLPAETEQILIAGQLTSVKNQIEIAFQQKEVLDQLIKSRFIEMFGDVHATSKWEKVKWSEVVTIQNGKDYKQNIVESGGFPVYGSGGEIARSSKYLCPENSVIIGRKGTINNPILMKEKFWNVDTAFGIIPSAKIDVQYLYIFCKLFDFRQLNKQATLPSTTKKDLLNITIPLPPFSLQQEFANFVEQVNKSQFVVQQQIEKLQTLYNSLAQEYFG